MVGRGIGELCVLRDDAWWHDAWTWESDTWGCSQPDVTSTSESGVAAKNLTKNSSGADASASGSRGVAAITASHLATPKAKPAPKASGASNCMLAAIMLGSFGTGSSFPLGCGSVKTDDMMTGVVDFDSWFAWSNLFVWQLVGDVGWLASCVT